MHSIEFMFTPNTVHVGCLYRMYSTVIGNGRTLQTDMTICGYRIPKGVSTLTNFSQEESVAQKYTGLSFEHFTHPLHEFYLVYPNFVNGSVI